MLSFTIVGEPIPQGSMKAFLPKGHSRPIVTSANPRLKQWRNTVRAAAIEAMGFGHPAGRRVPLRVEAIFFLPCVKSNRCMDAVKRPDLDKLTRSLLDGMTGVVYEDDSQVVEVHVFKLYGKPRAEVKVEEVLPAGRTLPLRVMKDSELPF